MALIEDARELQLEDRYASEGPFAEAMPEAAEPTARSAGFASWSETVTPFAESIGESAPQSESAQFLAEIFTELRDEAFDEALSHLVEETEQAVADRFTSESPTSAAERERFGDAHLAAVRFEAEQYLDALESGLTGMDVESLTEEQLDETLERFDPRPGDLTPAGEEFIGSLVRKAKAVVKKAVSVAASTAKGIVKGVGKLAGGLLGPVLQKLKGLIKPLLRRVLSFAIGRLPAPLQPAARTLAARFLSETGEAIPAGEEMVDEATASPTNLTDVEALAEQFDASLAETLAGEGPDRFDEQMFENGEAESGIESRELEMLAEARGALIDRIRSAQDEENLGPAIEQFVPALLGALRIGINLVGRPKVVGFLAGYLGKVIQKFVGPSLAGPLSNAIVDTGLRLITLEAESGEAGETRGDEAAPVALATVIEDTARRLAEQEEYVFEDETLMQLATAEAFSQAVATHFPPRFVRPALQQAPSLGGTFVTRRPRSVRTYRKYSRIPEVDITPQLADALPTFGGTTVGAALRAAGAALPLRARMHIYQSAAGTTLPNLVRIDRPGPRGGRGFVSTAGVHPLTPAAAGMLLREPALGVGVPASFTRSRNRIAVGQRFYLLEPVGESRRAVSPAGAAARIAPSRAWTKISLRRSRISVGFYLSEADAQTIVQAIREGRGGPALLQALLTAYRAMDRSAGAPQGRARISREEGEEFEDLAPAVRRMLPRGIMALLRRRVRAWVHPALAAWVRDNGEAFVRAAAHPDAGVTIRAELTAVPGLDLIRQAAAGGGGAAAASLSALRGKPVIAFSVTPGRGRPASRR